MTATLHIANAILLEIGRKREIKHERNKAMYSIQNKWQVLLT